jgi:hypothetical protein
MPLSLSHRESKSCGCLPVSASAERLLSVPAFGGGFVSVRERAEHLITLVDAAESYDKAHWSQSVVNREWAKVGTEAPWLARQLLAALNRIEQLEAELEAQKGVSAYRPEPQGGKLMLDGFHARDGWWFKRVADGGVQVRREGEYGGTVANIIFDANTWASIVAAVSVDGEDFRSFSFAQDLHMNGSGLNPKEADE